MSLLCIATLAMVTVANAASLPVIADVNVSDYHGDNDGHVERGECAAITFNVSSSVSISDVTVYLNDTQLFTSGSVGAASYHGSVTTTALTDKEYTFKIVVSTTDGSSSTKLVPYRVTRNYLGWIKVDELWAPTEMFHTPVRTGNVSTDYFVGACANITGSQTDGNHITLSGGQNIDMPDIYMKVDGGMLVNRTMECLIFLGKQNGSVPLGYTFDQGTYPIYYVDSKKNTVNCVLDASKDFDNKTLGVGLINLTMSSKDPVAYKDYIYHEIGTVKTDANGDAVLPAINNLPPDFYLVVVYDTNVSNGLGLVSAAPFYVVDYTPTIGVTYADKNMAPKKDLNPGDFTLVKTTMASAPDKKYLYATFIVSEADYHGTFDVNSTGMISDMNLTVDAFTAHFSGNYNDTLRNASSNITWAQQYVFDNWRNSNLSAAVGSGETKSLELPVKINDNAMPGKYYVVSAAVDPVSLRIVTLGQTTVTVVPPAQSSITIPWWLVLLLFVLLIIVAILLYWFYIRKA